jgi:tripartite-type tricarboxylate transporter receptor subunit TctC
VIGKIADAVHAMQDDPEVQKILADGGLEAMKETPQEFGERIRRDHDRFRDIVKAAGLKPQ